VSAAVAALIKFDRRTFYATLVIVVASYYVLFAVIGGSTPALMVESLVMTGFLVLAGVGFRRSQWVLVVALCAHGLFDLGHGRIITNPGVPAFWPAFCATYDVVVSGALAWIIIRARRMPGALAA
jgi:hypothetical protein